MHALLVAAALTLSPAHAADDWGALFGINPGDAMIYAEQQKAESERKIVEQRAKDVWWGRTVEPKYPLQCTFEEVAKALEIRTPGEMPPVYFESWDALRYYNFPQAYKNEKGQSIDRWINAYLPSTGAIYITDKGSNYKGRATIDDAIAGQFAAYLLARSTKRAGMDAEAVQAWYRNRQPCAKR